MSKKIIILSSSLIMLLSGSISAQTSPFDQSSNSNNNQNIRDDYITERQMQRHIDDLRMELEFIVMQNSPSLNDLPEPDSSLLGILGDDAKLKVIINGKKLKRDNEKYSINGN